MRDISALCCAIASVTILACAPSEPPPVARPTPTAAADEVISEMDFESGEAEHAGAESAEGGAQETPPPQ